MTLAGKKYCKKMHNNKHVNNAFAFGQGIINVILA
jgi:hypothetical protein